MPDDSKKSSFESLALAGFLIFASIAVTIFVYTTFISPAS